MKGQSVSRERERKDTPFEEKISTTRPSHEKRRRRREETKFFDEERLNETLAENTIFSTVALSSMTRNEGGIAQVLDSHLKFRKFTVLVVLLVVVSFCS
jgi:hypothetical protein